MSWASTHPVYFELSWSILSTIGIGNFLCSCLVCSITSYSQISAVPIVTSISGAIANGLCYYAFYQPGAPTTGRAVASTFADILWMIQEAGLSFYSYIILSRVLQHIRWKIFAGLFWSIMITIAGLRISIAICRVRSIFNGGDAFQELINNLHIGYFVSIAVVECISAYFLLTVFASAKTTSLKAAIKTGLLRYLMRSTEVRLALLAVIGVVRAITYSFQNSAQSATNLAGQIDRFVYTMECIFPIVMLIDMLSSKLVFSDQMYHSSSLSHPPSQGQPRQHPSMSNKLSYPAGMNGRTVEIHGGGTSARRNSSQERMLEAGMPERSPSVVEMDQLHTKRPGINKTVDIEVSVVHR